MTDRRLLNTHNYKFKYFSLFLKLFRFSSFPVSPSLVCIIGLVHKMITIHLHVCKWQNIAQGEYVFYRTVRLS